MPLLFIVALRLYPALGEEFYDAACTRVRSTAQFKGAEMAWLLDKWLGVVLAHRKINRLVVSVPFTIYKTGINRRGAGAGVGQGRCTWCLIAGGTSQST